MVWERENVLTKVNWFLKQENVEKNRWKENLKIADGLKPKTTQKKIESWRETRSFESYVKIDLFYETSRMLGKA